MRLRLGRQPSPIGTMLLVTDDDGALHSLHFEDHEPRLRLLLRQQYGACVLEDGAAPAAVTEAFSRYFEGDLSTLDTVRITTRGTPFQREVWTALRTIPAGGTTSYGQLAAQLGRAGSSRAVGLANGANPVSIVVPCHRVIGANGSLTGYGGGIERKRWLLDHEFRYAGSALAFG